MKHKLNYERDVTHLNSDELQDFIKEVSEAFRLTDISHDAGNMIDAIIYEWKESSIAISSLELAAAFNDDKVK